MLWLAVGDPCWQGKQLRKQVEVPLSCAAIGWGFVPPPRDLTAQESHTHTPLRIQQAKPSLRIASTYQAQAGSSLLLIVWMVCYRREGKKTNHFALKDPAP